MLLSQAYAGDTTSSFLPYPPGMPGVSAQPDPQQQQQHVAPSVVISAFGDSYFSGYKLREEQAFPGKLESTLNQKGYAVKVLPHGLSGSTTAEGINRVEMVINAEPNIVILELGGNDLLRGMSPEEMRKNLDTMIRKFLEARIWVVLVGAKAPLNYGEEYANRYNSVFTELAQLYKIPLVTNVLDSLIGKPELLLDDGLHPNALGVDVLVHGMLPVVEQVMNQR